MAMLKFMLVMFGVLFVLISAGDWLFLDNWLPVTNELQCAAAGSIIVAKLFVSVRSVTTTAIAVTARCV
ncbi:MAG: hypothetical protein KF878_07630 [Planctomycetes bacterium]|nr:hypothetical protein [Planctomycetota bacterium]